jgi:hypothetical protein
MKQLVAPISLILSEVCMNGRFSRCAAAKYLTLAKHFVRCERTQHKLNTSAVGSNQPFSALCMKVGFGPFMSFDTNGGKETFAACAKAGLSFNESGHRQC